MSYVAMSHQSTGYIVPAADWNQLIDNIAYLKTMVSANIWLGASSGISSTTDGALAGQLIEMATNKQNIPYVSFVDAAFDYLEWGFALPADYGGGTFTAQFYWFHPATTVNFGVAWGLQGRAYANDDALDQAWGTEVVTTDTGGTTSDFYLSGSSGAITLAGSPAALQYSKWRLRRKYDDANDNMAVAAYLIGVLLTYTRS